MRYLIKNGSIIDPARRVATVGDVLVEDGVVAQVVDLAELHPEREPIDHDAIEIIHARGCVVAPGFTDLHCHLREPGAEHQETIASGTLAAAQGGFTTVCAMPDTDPPLDRAAGVHQVQALAEAQGFVRVKPVGALTIGRDARQLSDMAELVEAGCIAFSDVGRPLNDSQLMRHALAYALALDVPLILHCEDTQLSGAWAMHEGAVSTRLGLPGFPAAAEESAIARTIALVELTGAHAHISRVSTAGGVALIRAARARGARITADVTPHHLTLTDAWVLGNLQAVGHAPKESPVAQRQRPGTSELGLRSWLDPIALPPFDSTTRVCPPLRSDHDVEALIEGLCDGTIDAIATDHSPYARVDTDREYALAAPGISGLETALGLVLTLVHRGELDLVNTVAKLTEGPAQVLGRAPATLRPGAAADLVIFDPDATWIVDTNAFVSKGRNNPLHGQRLKGRVMLTMVAGRVVYRAEDFDCAVQSAPSKIEGLLGGDA
jgi:dihydroorotase